MQTVPTIPDSAPFTGEQRAWLNGYLAGLFSRGPVAAIAPGGAPATPPAPALRPLTILFGSQTGTCEGLARRAAKAAGRHAFAASVMDLAGFTAAQLAQEQNILLITSTYGDGEPPDSAKALHAALAAADAPRLDRVRFSVCGLGDTNYVQFCKCAQDFDGFLEKLGATRVTARVDCDLDYEEKFNAWLNTALVALVGATGSVGLAAREVVVPAVAEAPAAAGFDRARPFAAPVRAVRGLNAAGSAKTVNHVEISLAGSGLVYEAGDALGVLPQNCPDLVAALLAALGCDGEEAVPSPAGGTMSLRRALTECHDLGRPSAEFMARYGATAEVGGDAAKAAAPHVLDVVLSRPETRLAPADFVRLLRKLQPRLYSIASSPRAHPGEVHLTVGAVRYEAHGRARKGVCSTFLGERCPAGATAQVFVHANKAFRLPADGGVPVIMIGPGTGIAPFRAFLAERRATGAPGRNWLFFGDQRAATDFLYRDELTQWVREGVLTRLDTAFSRDQAEKIYVQHRMQENAAELFAWLEAGAHCYVCGDAARMARDVDAALHRIIETAGGKTTDEAAAYVQELKTKKRYARDVY